MNNDPTKQDNSVDPIPTDESPLTETSDASSSQSQDLSGVAEVSALDAEPSTHADETSSSVPVSAASSSQLTQSDTTTDNLPPITPADTSQVHAAPVPPKKSKKKFIIGGIIASVLVLLGVGSALAYNLWYQNPDKVLSDAFINAVKAKTVQFNGSFEIKPASSSSMGFESFKISLDGKAEGSSTEQNAKLKITADGEDYAFSGSALVDSDSNIFFKVNDIEKLITEYAETQDGAYTDIPVQIRDIISSIDSKWVRITLDDLKEFGAPSDTIDDYKKDQECLQAAFDKLSDDREVSGQLVERYKDNKFVVVKDKLGSEDGSLGYRIEGDAGKFESFVKSLEDTTIVKEIGECGEEYKLDVSDFEVPDSTSSDNDTEVRLDLWVDRWSHQLTKATLYVKDDQAEGGFVFEPIFNESVSIEAPSDFVKITDLKEDIEAAMEELGLDSDGFSAGGYGAASTLTDAYTVSMVASMYYAENGSYPTLAQLKSFQPDSGNALDADLASRVVTSTPSAQKSDIIRYVRISNSKVEISYYDSASGQVKTLDDSGSISSSSIDI